MPLHKIKLLCHAAAGFVGRDCIQATISQIASAVPQPGGGQCYSSERRPRRCRHQAARFCCLSPVSLRSSSSTSALHRTPQSSVRRAASLVLPGHCSTASWSASGSIARRARSAAQAKPRRSAARRAWRRSTSSPQRRPQSWSSGGSSASLARGVRPNGRDDMRFRSKYSWRASVAPSPAVSASGRHRCASSAPRPAGPSACSTRLKCSHSCSRHTWSAIRAR
mmetsp:Transcript_13737/g.36287  ORF Transcript_13737/g.36287 Transcript_13737/m.36287 type:complete len:223 (+) Transcript_13737:94-762(+)